MTIIKELGKNKCEKVLFLFSYQILIVLLLCKIIINTRIHPILWHGTSLDGHGHWAAIYEDWNFNNGNYLFTTDTK